MHNRTRNMTTGTSSLLVWLLLACLSLIASQATAEIYRWVDESGNVHFSDQPGGKNSEKVEVDAGVTDAQRQDAERINQRYQQIYQQYREQEQKQAEQEQELAAKRKQREEYCRGLRKNVNTANQDYAFVRFNEEGQHEYLTDEERDQYRNKMNTLYNERCGDLE